MKSLLKILTISLLAIIQRPVSAQTSVATPQLKIGVSLSITSLTAEKLTYAKSVGIDYIETALGTLIDKKTSTFTKNDEEITALCQQVKRNAAAAGIMIWSVHMPYSEAIDISLGDESERQKVVALHKKVLSFVKILQPEIVLFHPSFFLGLNERELRKSQFIKSVTALNAAVKKINATMVVENMLGPQLTLGGGKRERPLNRTVEETAELMKRLPADVYSAIDLNHIKNPEKLIIAMGPRLKTLHVADGDGEEERHYFPCSGQGSNNWNAILGALTEVNYKGPFMFESAYTDLKDLKICYETLRKAFIAQSK